MNDRPTSHEEPTPAQPAPPVSRRPGRVGMGALKVIALAGVVGLGAGLGALLASQRVDSWLIGLAIAVISILLTLIVILVKIR